jgi:hypothetical protein
VNSQLFGEEKTQMKLSASNVVEKGTLQETTKIHESFQSKEGIDKNGKLTMVEEKPRKEESMSLRTNKKKV